MKNAKLITLVLLMFTLCLFGFFAGCGDDNPVTYIAPTGPQGEPGPQGEIGPTGPVEVGTLEVNVLVPHPCAETLLKAPENFTVDLVRSSTATTESGDDEVFASVDVIEDGTATFYPVPEGTYKVIVNSPGYNTYTKTGILVAPGEDPTTENITMEVAYSLNIADGCLYRINLYTGEAVLVAKVFDEGVYTTEIQFDGTFSGLTYTIAAVTGLTFNPMADEDADDYGWLYAVAFYLLGDESSITGGAYQQVIRINPSTGYWEPVGTGLNIPHDINAEFHLPFCLSFDSDGQLWVAAWQVEYVIGGIPLPVKSFLYEVDHTTGLATLPGVEIDDPSDYGDDTLLFGLANSPKEDELYCSSFKNCFTLGTSIEAGDHYKTEYLGDGAATIIFPIHGLELDNSEIPKLWSINLLGNIRTINQEDGNSTIVSNCQDGFIGLGIFPAPDAN